MLEILSATYGGVDVKDFLINCIEDNKLILNVDNNFFGFDPIKLQVKQLIIKYKFNENIFEEVFQEYSTCKIPTESKYENNLIEFIIPTYNRVNSLYSILASLLAQTNENWIATVVVDDVENENIKNIISKFDTDKIKYIFTNNRYNDWGQTPREIGKQQSTGDYVIMTGDDNYYVPVLVQELYNIIRTNRPGLIYWDMIHNHFDYSLFKCKTFYSNIDIGAFATRTDLAKQIVLGKDYASDGQFVLDIMNKFPQEKVIKIEKVLFVHN